MPTTTVLPLTEPSQAVGISPVQSPLIEVKKFNFFYGQKQALYDVSMEIPARQVTAFIGPSGCGKTTLLRNFNRMNDLIPRARHEGDILLAGRSIFDPKLKLINIRHCIGMIFQKSNPFPRTIYDNVVYGVRLAGERRKAVLNEIAETCLTRAALWDEVKDRLHDSALSLSGGQMQRLCIARAIACNPQILLMDEPCSALDPIATAKIEQLINELKSQFTIVIVTHNMAQAARCSDFTGFFYLGKLIEFNFTEQMFTNPQIKQTEEYIAGRFG